MSVVIENPILRGFNPDPSICRAGDDYYIATSTFEWFPGVQIHHSKDLVNWRLLCHPLNRATQLNMLGNPDSCGVWAPCLSWHDGMFYLLYTDVKRHDVSFKDTHNYLVTCETIDGEWSDPVYLNSSGFDPSLFHDDNGRKWYTNMLWDYRKQGSSSFAGVVLQEYSVDKKALVGPVMNIFEGSEPGITEGPHIYKWNGYYYLVTAEGGTAYDHAVTMARSKDIIGPYELDPIKHIVTSKDDPDACLQRAGHGDIVETTDGELYLVHLCSRPLGKRDRSPLGRETAIQRLKWTDDRWLRLENGGVVPQIQINVESDLHPWKKENPRSDFNDLKLPIDFQWLRTPYPETIYNLTSRPGYLRLFGCESIGSYFTQALVARRQQDFKYCATTSLEFEPVNSQQMAGLVCYYNSHKFYYLYISLDEDMGKNIGVMSCNAEPSAKLDFPLQDDLIAVKSEGPVYLRVEVDRAELYFSWSVDGNGWNKIPLQFNNGTLSDEAGDGMAANFTGCFVGMCCQDISGQKIHADFDFFEYLSE